MGSYGLSYVTVLIRQPRMISSVAAGNHPVMSVFLGLFPEMVLAMALVAWITLMQCRKTVRHRWESAENLGTSVIIVLGMFSVGMCLTAK